MFKTHWWSEIISLFPRVDTRLIPYIVKHTIYLRYLHIIYILYTILQYNTPNSSKSKPFKHTVPYTHHTKHTFFSLYSPFLLFYHQSSLRFFIYYSLSPHNNNNNTLTDNIHSPILSSPNAPNTPTPHYPPLLIILINMILYTNTFKINYTFINIEPWVCVHKYPIDNYSNSYRQLPKSIFLLY